MEELRNPILLGSVGLYLIFCIAVGLWAVRRTQSVKDFFMAGRDLGILVTGIAIFSSTMSGFGFVGGPGLVYSMGMSSVWMVVTAAVGYAIGDFLLGKRLRMFAGLFDTVSLPDVVAIRYRSETARFLTALAILLGVLGYLATQILAMAVVLQSLLQTTGYAPQIGIALCIVVSCSVLVFYSVTGGIIASVYTDLFQGAIMVVAGLLVFLTALSVFDGETSAAAILLQDDPEAISPWGTLGMIGCLSWYFMFAIGSAGQPHLVTKVMMIKEVKNYRFIPLVSVIGYSLTALLWISIGLVMRALVVQGSFSELASPDLAAPAFLQNFAHPLLAGVVFAGLLAAIMSTADAFLNIGAAALIHDIPTAFQRGLRRRELLWARVATFALAVLAALFAYYSYTVNDRLVALLGVFGWGTFGAALVPAVAIGCNWKRATALAANGAILSSILINVTIEVFDIPLPYGVHGGTLALLVSLTLFFGITLVSQAPELDPDVAAVMDL